MVTNRNDFLLDAADLAWLNQTFGKSRLHVFPEGGHLGNLGSPEVWTEILDQLDGLK